ncbi:MAG: flagellar basal body-associated FliL family protein [Bdellovibrionota bacterium]
MVDEGKITNNDIGSISPDIAQIEKELEREIEAVSKKSAAVISGVGVKDDPPLAKQVEENEGKKDQPEKAKSKISKLLLMGLKKQKNFIKSIGEFILSERMQKIFREAYGGLRSGDMVTKLVSGLFFLCIFTSVVTVLLFFQRFYLHYSSSELSQSRAQVSQNLGQFMQKQSEHAKQRYSEVVLGAFTVDMKPSDENEADGGLTVAELEITIQCDSKDTRYFIEERLHDAQDQVVGVLASVQREHLLTKTGKKKLKKAMLDQLNVWLPSGEVIDLFFSKLIMS